MATAQTIESQDISLGKLFSDFHVVPDYQREFVWETGQVEQLLEDIHTEFSSTDGSANSEYFIGSIVVCPRPDGVFELIDGQQRMTTAYLFLCAVRDHLEEQGEAPIDQLGHLIAASDIDAEGNDIYRYRVDLQYEDSGDILETVARGSASLEQHTDATRSIANMKNAYGVIRVFLQREFGDDVNAVRRFYSFFSKNVKLIRIRTQSVAHALKIFETINDRGLGLDSMDLLKNLMFMQAKQSDFERLKTRWKRLVDTLYRAGEKPLRFLRYFILATYDVDRLREDAIYSWFVGSESQCGYQSDPIAFVDGLVDAAQAYSHFLGGRDAWGNRNRYLENIRYLSGSARQHLILLLASRKLPPDAFSELCRDVENLFFAYIITREATREFERKFTQWARELRRVSDQQGLAEFRRRRFEPARRELTQRFDLAFRGLDAAAIQKYRMRYLLGKLTQYVNEQAYGSEGAEASLETFVNSKVHVEHILPQTATDEVLAEFDEPSLAEECIQRLGNLTLVEQPLNTSLGNKPFSQKKDVYTHSKFLLTSGISQKVVIGANTAVDRAVREIEPFNTWDSTAIEMRQMMLGQLARRVWEMPNPGQGQTDP